MDRKQFLKTCAYACLGGSALSMVLQACAASTYIAKTTVDKNRIVLKRTEFNQTDEKKGPRKYLIVKNDKFQFPICVYTLGDDKYSAVLMECTHKGCELQANTEFLVCPCHGSEFSKQGVVQTPPAERNLKSFTISTDEENIYIHV